MISDFLHPVWKQRVLGGSDLNSVILKSIDDELTEAQMDLIQSKLSLYVNTAQDTFLDYWGKWLGLSRVDGWEDDVYREKIINHVLHSRNTIESLREAIANFIQTNEDNIYIYEPYVDMFIWNYSTYNSLSFFSDEYYRYMVIDVKISTPFTQDVSKIINLFRPAGVLWVMSLDINGYSDALNIINYGINGSAPNYINITEYSGFSNKISYNINPSIDTTSTTIDPFTYNDPNSTWNGGKAYYKVSSYLDNYMYLGLNKLNGNPDPSVGFKDSRNYVTQLDVDSNNMMSSKNNNGHTFLLGQDPTLNPNLLTGTSQNYQSFNVKTTDTTYGQVTAQANSYYTFSGYFSVSQDFTGTIMPQIFLMTSSSGAVGGSGDAQTFTNPTSGTDYYFSVTTTKTNDVDGLVKGYFRASSGVTIQVKLGKLEKGSMATGWCPNPNDGLDVSLIGASYVGALSSYILASLSLSNGMIAVGSNILQASGNYQSATDLSSAGGISINPTFSQTYNSADKAIVITKATASNAQHLGWNIPQGLLVSTTYTLSVKYKASITSTGVGMQFGYNGNYNVADPIFQTATDWVTAKITFTTRTANTNTNSTGSNAIWFSSTEFNVGDYIEVQWIKLELGSVATPWIPNVADPSFATNASTLGHVYLSNRIKNQSNYSTQVNIRLYNSTLGLWIIYDSFLLNPNIYYDSIIDITNEFKSLISSQGVFYYKIEPVTINSNLYLNVDYTGMSFSTKTRNPVGSFYTSSYDSEVVMGS